MRVSPTAGVWTVLFLGALAHVVWYLERGSLWLDEAYLALNVLHRSPVELLETLSFGQGAPWGFLEAEKLAVSILGPGDWSFRLVPLLAALAALPLFWHVASFYVRGPALLLALMLFSFSPLLVLYSAEAKQYAVEVLASVVALWLAHGATQLSDWPRAIAVAVAGALLLWFSHGAMMVLGAAGLAVGAHALVRRDWEALRRLSIVGFAWGASACAFFLLAWPKLAHLRETQTAQEGYAVPFPPRSAAEAKLLANTVSDIVELPFGFHARPWGNLTGAAAALLALAGALSLMRRDRLGTVVLAAPLIAAATALASGLYPYAPRFLLFLVPIIVVLVAAGTAAGLKLISQPGLKRRFVTAAAVAAAAVAAAAVAAAAFLLSVTGASTARLLSGRWETHEIRPILEHIRSVWRPGDGLYLYGLSQYPARYNAEVDGVNTSSEGNTLWPVVPTSGTSTDAPALRSAPPRLIVRRFREDASTFVRDVAALEGRRRVWFVFSHIFRRKGGISVEDYDRYVAALDAAGVRLATIRHGRNLALLYDLGA
jgi:hypothetical protein